MALRVRPLVQVPAPTDTGALDLSATPYIDARTLWLDGLHLLHNWALDRFPVGCMVGDYKFAEALNVHRVISDIWLCALSKSDLVESILISSFNQDAHGFRLKPAAQRVSGVLVRHSLQKYDPWVDREFDAEIPNALFADHYVDQYYDVMINETWVYEKKARKRSNGSLFAAVSVKDMPRYENAAKARSYEGKPAVDWWRDAIDAAANM